MSGHVCARTWDSKVSDTALPCAESPTGSTKRDRAIEFSTRSLRDGPMLTRVLCISGGRSGVMISARPAFMVLANVHSPFANFAKAYRRGGCCAAALWGGRASGKERFILGIVRSSRDGQVLNGRQVAAGSTERRLCGEQDARARDPIEGTPDERFPYPGAWRPGNRAKKRVVRLRVPEGSFVRCVRAWKREGGRGTRGRNEGSDATMALRSKLGNM